MYNPIMLIPTILAPLSGALVAWISVTTGFINSMNFNPAVSVAWVISFLKRWHLILDRYCCHNHCTMCHLLFFLQAA